MKTNRPFHLLPLGIMFLSGMVARTEHPNEWALRTADEAFQVFYTATPSPIPLNQPFSLVVRVEPAGKPIDAFSLAVDARMPQHRHGMNTRPVVNDLGGGRYRVDGMLFHMAGRWELYFDISVHGLTTRAQAEVTLD